VIELACVVVVIDFDFDLVGVSVIARLRSEGLRAAAS
jgi:hypothetical protein